MDADRFAALSRALTESLSRRTTFGAGLIAACSSLLGSADADAKRKHKHKKKKCKADTKKCGKACIPASSCCACGDGETCSNGSCICVAGSNCGSDDDGACVCQTTADGPNVCSKNLYETRVSGCFECPAGANCVSFGSGGIYCYKPCGAP